jgi:hypothetical protein
MEEWLFLGTKWRKQRGKAIKEFIHIINLAETITTRKVD